jgi:hypothetical protein
MLGCFERKILVLRSIFGATQEGGMWRRRYNFERYRLYKELDIVKTIKIGRLRWIGHFMRIDVDDPSGRHCLKNLLDSVGEGDLDVEEDLGIIGIRVWRRTAMDRDTWKSVLKEAEAHLGL